VYQLVIYKLISSQYSVISSELKDENKWFEHIIYEANKHLRELGHFYVYKEENRRSESTKTAYEVKKVSA